MGSCKAVDLVAAAAASLLAEAAEASFFSSIVRISFMVLGQKISLTKKTLPITTQKGSPPPMEWEHMLQLITCKVTDMGRGTYRGRVAFILTY